MSFEIKKSPDRIAICGTGHGWQLLPKNTNQTIYALNDYVRVERYGIKPDKLFILDVLDEKPQIVSGIDNLGEIIKRINDLGIPLIAPFKYEEIPLSESFPLKECVKRFGTPYFLNTISYMIAYALLQGAKEISLYGINQASSSEYFYEKASVEYWLGIANGLGVKITIYGNKSELLSNKNRFGGAILYGYNMTYENLLNADEKYGEAIIKKLTAPIQEKSRTVREIN